MWWKIQKIEIVKVLNYVGSIKVGKYGNGKIAIQLVNSTGVLAKLTVNLETNQNQLTTHINNNGIPATDIIKALTQHGYIYPEFTEVTKSGYITYPEVKLTQKTLDLVFKKK